MDDRHNGALEAGGAQFTLDDQTFHAVKPRTHYRTDWCGIPWYYRGRHFKALSKDQKTGALFYTSAMGGGNWILYEEIGTGRQLARQEAPKGSDFHCNLRFEEAGVYIDIINNNAFSGENAVYQVCSETKEWVKVLGPMIAAAIQAAAV